MRGAPAIVDPDLTGKPFGSPEMMKAMQEMFGAFEDDLTQALIPYHRFEFQDRRGPRSSRDGRAFDGWNADFPNHIRSS